MSEDSIERKKRLVFVSVSTNVHGRKLANLEHVLQRNVSPDAAHLSDLHLNILAPLIFLKFPMIMNNLVSLRSNYFIIVQ